MFIANGGAKLANESAAIGDDEHMPAGNNLEKVRVDLGVRPDIDRQFLGKFADQGASVVFSRLGPPARQLPLVP
ncbi:MAG TPA: hypothetical protein VJU77_06690 [Chthoniobacterales bacterium]|nr:hypothetical protein [Chthoniobacterales bacterium]